MKFKSIIGVLALGFIGACSNPPPKIAGPPGGLPPSPPARGGSINYVIDPARSELRLLVYRAGAMARLGHNHVIVNHPLGWVHWAPRSADAGFALQLKTDGFIVDDDAARRAAGDDFTTLVDDDAKRGTLRNMLGADLLNADAYPALLIRSVSIAGDEPALKALLVIEVAGHATRMTLALNVRHGDGNLTADAEFTLRQSELGLKPFSVMLGALQVRDDFTVKCHIVAAARGAT
jgi:YceI-like domain